MDGVTFTKAKLPKDLDESIQQTQTTLVKGFKENFTYASKVLTEKTAGVRENVQKGEAIGKKIESRLQGGNFVAQKPSALKTQIS